MGLWGVFRNMQGSGLRGSAALKVVTFLHITTPKPGRSIAACLYCRFHFCRTTTQQTGTTQGLRLC